VYVHHLHLFRCDFIDVCAQVCTNTLKNTCTHSYTYFVHTYVSVLLCSRMHVLIVYTHTHIYLQGNIHINTHKHTYTYISRYIQTYTPQTCIHTHKQVHTTLHGGSKDHSVSLHVENPLQVCTCMHVFVHACMYVRTSASAYMSRIRFRYACVCMFL
jgi:hypothetical protein